MLRIKTSIGRIVRYSCVHHARNRRSPSRFTTGSGVDRSSAVSSTSTSPPPEAAGHAVGRFCNPTGRVRIGGDQLHDSDPERGKHNTLHRQPGQAQQAPRIPTTVIRG
jgi:hypothetical protein